MISRSDENPLTTAKGQNCESSLERENQYFEGGADEEDEVVLSLFLCWVEIPPTVVTKFHSSL